MTASAGLSVEVSQLGGYASVTSAGSIDFTTHPVLEEKLGEAVRMTRLAVLVDLSGVAFCDSSGLNSFARAYRQAMSRGITIIVYGLQERVRRVFAITRLDEAFYPHPDLETALRWLETGARNSDAS